MKVSFLSSFLPILLVLFRNVDCKKNCDDVPPFDEHRLNETIALPKDYIRRIFLTKRRMQTIVDDVNTWTDILLAHSNTAINNFGLDKLKLPSIHKQLKWGIFKGSVDMVNGVATEWATLNRVKKIEVNPNHQHKYYAVILPFEIESMKITYNFKASIWNVGPQGIVETLLSNIGILLKARFSTKTYNLEIVSFKIHTIGNIKVTVLKAGELLNWFVNALTESIKETAEETILVKVSKACEDMIKVFAKQINEIIEYLRNFKLEL